MRRSDYQTYLSFDSELFKLFSRLDDDFSFTISTADDRDLVFNLTPFTVDLKGSPSKTTDPISAIIITRSLHLRLSEMNLNNKSTFDTVLYCIILYCIIV